MTQLFARRANSPSSMAEGIPTGKAGRNPLREGLRLPRTPDPCALVIFGASGDLTRRKLFPAVYSLAVRDLLPDQFAIVGVARTRETDAQFRRRMKEAVREFGRDKLDEKVWRRLAAGMHYVATDFAAERGEDRLVDLLAKLDDERGTAGNRVYYLAVPPSAIAVVVDRLGRRRGEWPGWTRLIVEKPFGSDRASARDLNEELSHFFEEREIYRIDHYLGKETVQNLLALRFANGIFEPIWNRQFVDHVEITVAESIGIEGRSAFYEHAGAIRDVFQNHLLQLVALTAMEPPVDFTSESVRNEKVKVLRAMHTPGAKHVVRGQYGRGFVEGKEVPGYREEPGVADDSTTDTFVAAKLYVDNWRWADTPFYVRTGKRLPKRETTIAIQFKRAPHPPFAKEASEGLRPNVLLVHVQPDEGVSLAIGAKVPGQGMTIRTVHMDFLYGGAFRTELPEAYERLILDCLFGDSTLFTRADEVDEQWALVDSIVAAWKRDRTAFPNYDAGTWGPAAADELLRREGREWRRR
jgi:glucose-6-phosphate 1-dehydrogenase